MVVALAQLQMLVVLAEVVVEVGVSGLAKALELVEVRETLQLLYRHKAIMVEQPYYQHQLPVAAVAQESQEAMHNRLLGFKVVLALVAQVQNLALRVQVFFVLAVVAAIVAVRAAQAAVRVVLVVVVLVRDGPSSTANKME